MLILDSQPTFASQQSINCVSSSSFHQQSAEIAYIHRLVGPETDELRNRSSRQGTKGKDTALHTKMDLTVSDTMDYDSNSQTINRTPSVDLKAHLREVLSGESTAPPLSEAHQLTSEFRRSPLLETQERAEESVPKPCSHRSLANTSPLAQFVSGEVGVRSETIGREWHCKETLEPEEPVAASLTLELDDLRDTGTTLTAKELANETAKSVAMTLHLSGIEDEVDENFAEPESVLPVSQLSKASQTVVMSQTSHLSQASQSFQISPNSQLHELKALGLIRTSSCRSQDVKLSQTNTPETKKPEIETCNLLLPVSDPSEDVYASDRGIY